MEDSRMKFTNRFAMFVFVTVIFAFGISFFSMRAAAQDEGWQIVRADYGSRNQRSDVTDILKDLISRGGVNGRVAVNNQTMGGDPAVGADWGVVDPILSKRDQSNPRRDEIPEDIRPRQSS